MRIWWALALSASVVLGSAAVWMGGLNQDEGWYLYAANLVSEGKILYRDFFFTQGPVMPWVYARFVWIWKSFGILGARCFTLLLGAMGILLAAGLARRLAPTDRRGLAAWIVLLLLGCNLYHLYYLAIPKAYALASCFVLAGFYLATFDAFACALGSGILLAFAAGTRISLVALLPVVGLGFLLAKQWKSVLGFCLGGLGALALVYGGPLCDAVSRAGLVAAQQYHAARGGSDPVWVIGSLSRLVRWYLPVFVVLGLAFARPCRAFRRPAVLLWGFLLVFAVQLLAPFPYEDYQVPVMGLLAVYAAVNFVSGERPAERVWTVLLVLGLSFAHSFGSPLLEKWATNGQDRFWTLKKSSTELSQLRQVARRIEQLDPGGKELLTQDLYLAIETDRRVPDGLEMGPFAQLSDAEWRRLLETVDSPVAALSGYTFAIRPPKCDERPMEDQLAYWQLLKRRYRLVDREEAFGQQTTPLVILRRN